MGYNTSQAEDRKGGLAMTTPKRLYRSRNDRMIGGVCGGLAEYFNIDPVLVRVITVVVGLFALSGVLAYLILWIVVPEEPVAGP